MGDYSEISLINKNCSKMGLAFSCDTSELVMANSSLGIKADLLFQKGMYDVIASDIISDSLNKLACFGGEILSLGYNISTKEPEHQNIQLIINSIQKNLNLYDCDKTLKNVEETGYNIDKFDINAVSIGKYTKRDTDIISGDIIIGLTTDKIHLGLYPHLINKYKDGLLTVDEFESCLEPVNNYYTEIINLYRRHKIKDCVYIDTKNIKEQINNALPVGLKCDINLRHIPHQPIIDKLCEADGTNYYEEYGSGICCCLITDKASNEIFFEDCQKFNPFVFGTIG